MPSPQKPASLKHELRTPLNHIIGYCEMLMEEAEDQSLNVFQPDLEHIHAAGKRLLSVVNDLFDPVKGVAYRRDRSLVDHEVRTPLNQIIGYAEILEEEAQERGLESFVADLKRINTAARELLRCVMEHLPRPDAVPAFEQSSSNSGATTFIRRERPAESRRPSLASVPVLTGTLLVVDDDEANRSMLARRLARLGHQVTSAENGRDALEKMRAQQFDLVLLDIQMPEMNGYQVLEHLKADPMLCTIPVIVLSASSETERVAHCIEMGAEDYLPKPFDPILLQARITASLEKKRLRDREVSYLRQIEEAKKRSDELLEIILPHDVAEELKATHAVKPRRFEKVAVLFCDIVGFTAYCELHPPEEIHRHLQALVEEFEIIAARHGLEKIKTIGDSFMATAGLLAPLRHPALHCVRAGLEMVTAARALPPRWEVRVGIHAGPVIAGVVGRRKYQFDVWGDTVNTAARMEKAAMPGSVSVNRDTWNLLEHDCHAQPQGSIQIKGKGEMELFRIESVQSG